MVFNVAPFGEIIRLDYSSSVLCIFIGPSSLPYTVCWLDFPPNFFSVSSTSYDETFWTEVQHLFLTLHLYFVSLDCFDYKFHTAKDKLDFKMLLQGIHKDE